MQGNEMNYAGKRVNQTQKIKKNKSVERKGTFLMEKCK